MGLAMKTTIELPDELLIEAKKRAAEERTSLREVMERALHKELGATPSPKKRRPKIKWVTVAGGLPAGLDVSNRREMMAWLMNDRT
jgi:hypothetical protein